MRRAHVPRVREDGASAVEFAIVAPMLFMMLFGIIQFGILFAQDLAVSNAARQAARAGVVPGGTCSVIAAEVEQGAQTLGLDTSDATSFDFDVHTSDDLPPGGTDLCPAPPYSSTYLCDGKPFGTDLHVVVAYDASLAIPMVGAFDSLTLTSTGFYRCENVS